MLIEASCFQHFSMSQSNFLFDLGQIGNFSYD